jgi:hypothetical protein
MLFIYKNKGILVPIYVIVSFIGIAILSGILKRNIGGIFANEYDYKIILGLGFLISGLWTYFTSEEYIKKDGVKIKVNIENTFFFIPMKIWGYIFIGAGLLFLLLGFISNFIK